MQTRCFQLKVREADALKAGRQTRFLRPLKAPTPVGTTHYNRSLTARTYTPHNAHADNGPAVECPYGQIDDVLWGKYVVGRSVDQKPLRNGRLQTDIWLRITNVMLFRLSLASSLDLPRHGIHQHQHNGLYCLPIGSGVGSFQTTDPAVAVRVRHELTYDLDAGQDPFVWIIDVERIDPPLAS